MDFGWVLATTPDLWPLEISLFAESFSPTILTLTPLYVKIDTYRAIDCLPWTIRETQRTLKPLLK